MNQYENTKRVTKRKLSDNNDLIGDIDTFMKNINVLEEQNRELDKEIDKFLECDQDVRKKLLDRERSPLRLGDLYEGPVT
jgi:chromosome segregation ATPase